MWVLGWPLGHFKYFPHWFQKGPVYCFFQTALKANQGEASTKIPGTCGIDVACIRCNGRIVWIPQIKSPEESYV